jgi:hypothetical protein
MSVTCCEHPAAVHKPGCIWCEDKHELVEDEQ